MNYIFVGEQPSARAEKIGATWQNGKLSGKTLRYSLIAIGINPDLQQYCNLWGNNKYFNDPEKFHAFALDIIRAFQLKGYQVIGMGKKVCKNLTQENIDHIRIIHPAARGLIRRTECYQQHLKERLIYDF